MMQTVQLSISDGPYQASVREALTRSCAWRVECAVDPDPSRRGVLVLDEAAFERLPLPLSNPERVVLITRKDPQSLSEAWEAGIVSVVADTDPLSTVLLAIMAAALRVANSDPAPVAAAEISGISPNASSGPAQLAPQNRTYGSKRCKIQ
jgi:hypothetical protein